MLGDPKRPTGSQRAGSPKPSSWERLSLGFPTRRAPTKTKLGNKMKRAPTKQEGGTRRKGKKKKKNGALQAAEVNANVMLNDMLAEEGRKVKSWKCGKDTLLSAPHSEEIYRDMRKRHGLRSGRCNVEPF